MIPVEQAETLIMTHVRDYGVETVGLFDSVRRVIREPVLADRALPPYDRVTMDGICINYDAFEQGLRQFRIAATIAAGMEKAHLEDSSTCFQIMTGAVLSKGADTVIRVEDLEIVDDVATILTDDVRRGQNVHRYGSDRSAGDLLISPGKRIGAAEINVLATVGKTTVNVSKVPRVVLISTGDELVEIDQTPGPHQVRRSNMYGLYAHLSSYQIPMDARHLPDDPAIIREKIRNYLETYDVILLSGGVSKGKFDHIPAVLDELGVEKVFHKVFQRPGKPFWFGKHPGGTVVFALPGNPVSSFVCTFRYVVPWLEACLGMPPDHQYARLASPITFKKDLTYFAQVRFINRQGELLAEPVQGNGSGDLANMVDADAFMELPRGQDLFDAGEAYRIFSFR